MKKMSKKPTNLDVINYSLTVGLILGITIGLASGVLGTNRYNEYKYGDCICPIDNKYQPANSASTASETLNLPSIPDIPDIEQY